MCAVADDQTAGCVSEEYWPCRAGPCGLQRPGLFAVDCAIGLWFVDRIGKDSLIGANSINYL